MKITCLVEDTCNVEELKSEHGVSFYVETDQHKLLFDVGQTDLFLKNASVLGIDLSLVDIVIISHGHYDHGGGLETFLNVNSKAKIYINKHAFESHYSMREGNEMTYNGLDQKLINADQIIFTDELLNIDNQLTVFSDVDGQEYYPKSNQTLYKKIDQHYINDDFIHEQNLIINENGKHVLLAGCAHHGIINILDKASKHIYPKRISTLLGGFHFVSRFPELAEKQENIKNIANNLLKQHVMSYTGHCTGLKGFTILKEVMKDKIQYFNTGFEIDI